VGTLTGGVASCANPVNDYYTKVDYAWDYYDAPAKQLKAWLDPGGTGTVKLDGYDPLATTAIEPDPEMAADPGPLCRIYPNPAGHRLHIETDLRGPDGTRISVFHISGALLMRLEAPSHGPISLDVSPLEPGVYILRVSQGEQTAHQRFIIAR
jgi:hypothetical protein